MTFLEALYGSQYDEIDKRGGDRSKARLNGNLFLTAFIIVLLSIAFIIILKISSAMAAAVNHSISEHFISGKAAGKILAIPILAVLYFIIAKTVGSETNFKLHVDGYLQCPEHEKEQANKKLLVP